jgi:hypothetical protein
MNGAAEDKMVWPELPWEAWSKTAETLHMWTQIVGKTRLALTPLQNHWWNVALYVTAHGIGTPAMACGDDVLDIEFDFVAHELHMRLESGKHESIELKPRSVADFYHEYLRRLDALGVRVKIWPMPVEIANPIRFDQDTEHNAYDAEFAHRFWQVLSGTQNVMRAWTTDFLGKVSPINFFWGSFDLAMTRFSGRPAPPRPGADSIQREAYSHEVISAGFWPGNGGYGAAALYCYAAPVPDGLAEKTVSPVAAKWDKALGEFVLRYDDLRQLPYPEEALLEFYQTAYQAAADSAKWDRAALERH